MSRIPQIYRLPFEVPLRWQDDMTEVLPNAVLAFFNGAILTAEQFELVREYGEYYVNAPCWDANPHHDADSRAGLAKLRERVKHLGTTDELNSWLHECLKVGLDPF